MRAYYDEEFDDSAAPVVHFENVGVRYGMGPEVLRDLTFSIEPNSFQFLTGPSGAGKTTLLRLILLSVKPTRGLISLFGEDVSRISKDELTGLRRRMGVVFQDFRLLDHLTTYENVVLPLRVLGKDEQGYRGEVTELLHWVGLGDRMDVLPPVLSGGQKQRILLARALYRRPRILFLDEATSHLDVERERCVNDAVRALPLTRIIVAHRPETIASATRVIALVDGQVTQDLRTVTPASNLN